MFDSLHQYCTTFFIDFPYVLYGKTAKKTTIKHDFVWGDSYAVGVAVALRGSGRLPRARAAVRSYETISIVFLLISWNRQ